VNALPDATLANFAAQTPRMTGGNTLFAASYARELRTIATRRQHRSPRSVQRQLGPSELGAACDRLVVGKMAGEPITNHVSSPWPSIVGTAVHAWLADAFLKENESDKVLRWLPERRVRAAILGHHPGTADLYDVFTKSVVDHKGLHTETPVPTPDGWTTIGALQESDQVFGSDGQICAVTRTYPVQYRDCYRVTFDDQSSLVCDDVQLWSLIKGTTRHPQPVTLSTAEAAGNIWNGQSRPQRHLRIPVNTPLRLPEARLPVHPYVLGCWLGDGHVSGGAIGKPGDDLFENIRACGYEASPPHGKRKLTRTVYGLVPQLREAGLVWISEEHRHTSHGQLAGHKRVPGEYLRASTDQRLALLQGLMDTDGTWNRKRNQAVFTTTDKQLADDAAELARSLGWKARVLPQQAHGSGLTVTAYHVAFTPYGANPFRLPRKAGLVRMPGTTRARYRIIRSIEPVLSVPTRCIDVDSADHLYLAGTEMIPVHNCVGQTTLRKFMSEAGPSRIYRVQGIIYGQGYIDLGLPVHRVIIAAWPRTAATLDELYCWEWPWNQAEADAVLRQVAAQTEARRQVARMVMSRQISISQVRRTPGEECYFCLGGSTEIVTRDGIKPIRELAGTSPELLVPVERRNPGLAVQGRFIPVPVRSFGQQQLWKITLSSRRGEKIVYATAEHRWLLTARESRAENPENPLRPLTDRWPERTTSQLQPGDRLRPLRAYPPPKVQMMPPAVAQGFVFGDGTRGQGNRPATLNIYGNGKDEALLPFFPLTEPAQYDGVKHIYGLPRFWKDLPPVRESRTFLLSWLAGYFAADGCVSDAGQAVLDSADEQAIRFARDVAAICGIGYSPIRSRMRLGTGTGPSRLWSVSFRRRDLPSWFFIIKEHARRAVAVNETQARGTFWTVKSAEVTRRVGEVFCATVPGAGMFGLADDLLTGNCPFYRPQSALDDGPGCPGQSAPAPP
jgi:hypothetical protein